jgi:integrase
MRSLSPDAYWSSMLQTWSSNEVWIIPGSRYKTKLDHAIPVIDATRALIGPKPKDFRGNSWFIFSTTNGVRPFSGFSKAKKVLDVEIAKTRQAAGREPLPRWTLHDLRLTGRSLMSRARVPSDHAERAMGHVIGGVRETYDRYEYLDEKRDALAKLSALIREIICQSHTLELPEAKDRSIMFEAA